VPERAQFSLQAVFLAIAAISLPIAMMTSGDQSVRFWGGILLAPGLGGCAGFFVGGWGGTWPGICIAALLTLVTLFITASLFSV
jgi:hypothetical protein